jgi:hypothetical protein
MEQLQAEVISRQQVKPNWTKTAADLQIAEAEDEKRAMVQGITSILTLVVDHNFLPLKTQPSNDV